MKHPSLEDPFPPHPSKGSKKKGGRTEVDEATALCLSFPICQAGMVMNLAPRAAGRIRCVNPCKAPKTGGANTWSGHKAFQPGCSSTSPQFKRVLAKACGGAVKCCGCPEPDLGEPQAAAGLEGREGRQMTDRGSSQPCRKNPGQVGSQARACHGGIPGDGVPWTKGNYADGAVAGRSGGCGN